MLLALSAFFASLAAHTAAAQLLGVVEGVHYEVIDPPAPVTITDPDRIEVTEVFWYGCPQCFVFEPTMRNWEQRMRGDLAFARVPAVWHQAMATHARIFYAADALGVQRQVHLAAFSAVQEQGNPLRTEEQIKALFRSEGVEDEQFEQAWNSPEVDAAVANAKVRMEEFGLHNLPGLIVNGTYRVTRNSAVSTHDDMVVVVNLLLREIRNLRRPD